MKEMFKKTLAVIFALNFILLLSVKVIAENANYSYTPPDNMKPYDNNDESVSDDMHKDCWVSLSFENEIQLAVIDIVDDLPRFVNINDIYESYINAAFDGIRESENNGEIKDLVIGENKFKYYNNCYCIESDYYCVDISKENELPYYAKVILFLSKEHAFCFSLKSLKKENIDDLTESLNTFTVNESLLTTTVAASSENTEMVLSDTIADSDADTPLGLVSLPIIILIIIVLLILRKFFNAKKKKSTKKNINTPFSENMIAESVTEKSYNGGNDGNSIVGYYSDSLSNETTEFNNAILFCKNTLNAGDIKNAKLQADKLMKSKYREASLASGKELCCLDNNEYITTITEYPQLKGMPVNHNDYTGLLLTYCRIIDKTNITDPDKKAQAQTTKKHLLEISKKLSPCRAELWKELATVTNNKEKYNYCLSQYKKYSL